MVEAEADLLINSEESQTVFEGQQMLMQPPPVEIEKQQQRKKVMTLLMSVVILIVGLTAATVYFFSPNPNQVVLQTEEITASPMPIFTDPLKEAELQRVEAIVEQAQPDLLLVPPPQVDMTVVF
jgi:hypothetical protein